MPPAHDDDPQFSALVEETRRTIASPDFARVFDVCMERAVEVLFDDLEKEVYFPNSMQQQFVASEGSSGILPGGDEVRIKLAALLPGLTRWSRDVLNGLPNTLVDVSPASDLVRHIRKADLLSHTDVNEYTGDRRFVRYCIYKV